jgi:hypothetical protein
VNAPGFTYSFTLSDSSDCAATGRTVNAVLTVIQHGKVSVLASQSATL